MKVKLNIDTQELKEKPAAFDGRLRNRLCNQNSVREVTPAQLMECITRGISFTPAVMTGTKGESWQSQQVICADIDNDTGNKEPLPQPLTPDQAREIMNQYGIDPYFMYYSFSNKEGWPKFRILLILDRPITDPNQAEELNIKFTGIFNRAVAHCADPTNKDLARLYYGGRPDSIIYASETVTKIETLQALPETPQKAESAAEWWTLPTRPKKARKQRLADLQMQFEADKESFDLAKYVEITTSSRPVRRGNALFFNPCPVCGHKDDFQVTGPLYHCHSASGGSGGSIIDYLINAEGLKTSAAIEKFKYEIMGYDRDEWREAYREETGPAERTFSEPADRLPGEENKTAEIENEGAAPNPGKDALTQFVEKIQTEAYKPYSTGLAFFDELIGGGIIQQSLLLLLAAPGAGKTTLAQQLAETMAREKKPVIYLNFEMSREQMLAKAISAKMHREGRGEKTALDILQGYNWSEEDGEAINRTLEEYRQESYPHIRYNPDGVTSELSELLGYLNGIGEREKAAGRPVPAVVVDYLHLIKSRDRIENQELIKQAVLGLKEYAVKYGTFVIAIVATNRSSNKAGRITMESGRDSSNLEYTADYQVSLNYYDIDQRYIEPDDVDEIADLQQQPLKKMMLRVLKSRFSQPGKAAAVMFDSAHNTFYGTIGEDVTSRKPRKKNKADKQKAGKLLEYVQNYPSWNPGGARYPFTKEAADYFEVREQTIERWADDAGIIIKDGVLKPGE